MLRAIREGRTVFLMPDAPSWCECVQYDGDLCPACKEELYHNKTIVGTAEPDQIYDFERNVYIDIISVDLE